jgi:tellurite resistance protein TerC
LFADLLAQPLAPAIAAAAQSLASTELRPLAYGAFLLLIAGCLLLDLGVFHRTPHAVSAREATVWSCVWISLSLSFAVFVWFAYEHHWLGLGLDVDTGAHDGHSLVHRNIGGREACEQYLTGYLVEFSLAMDNILVIAIVLSAFGIPRQYQHRVLYWGILGAVAMRGAMIWLGAELVHRHSWVLVLFGAFLLATALKLAFARGEPDPANNVLVRLLRRIVPVRTFHDGERFVTRRTLPPPAPGPLGRLALTPCGIALIVVEVTDLIFAVDSIPAVFAVTLDPFLVFTSNIFAILGLRSLYFALAAALQRFRFLQPALVLVLAFVGVKLVLLALPPWLDDLGALVGIAMAPRAAFAIDTRASLLIVVGVLAAALLLSVLLPGRKAPRG